MCPAREHIEECNLDYCEWCDHYVEFFMCCEYCGHIGWIDCDGWFRSDDGRIFCNEDCWEKM